MIELERSSWGHDRDECCEGDFRLDNIRSCWRQIAELKQIIAEIIGEIGGPVKTGPIMGVVSGTNAAAGMVGEVVSTSLTGTFTPAAQSQALSSVVLQPGDWDVSLKCSLEAPSGSVGNTGGSIELSPLPAGVQPIEAEFYTSGTNKVASVGMSAQPAQVNITTPTLLAFMLKTNQPGYATGDEAGGTFTVEVRARRMR
jgi:hypothetical protein